MDISFSIILELTMKPQISISKVLQDNDQPTLDLLIQSVSESSITIKNKVNSVLELFYWAETLEKARRIICQLKIAQQKQLIEVQLQIEILSQQNLKQQEETHNLKQRINVLDQQIEEQNITIKSIQDVRNHDTQQLIDKIASLEQEKDQIVKTNQQDTEILTQKIVIFEKNQCKNLMTIQKQNDQINQFQQQGQALQAQIQIDLQKKTAELLEIKNQLHEMKDKIIEKEKIIDNLENQRREDKEKIEDVLNTAESQNQQQLQQAQQIIQSQKTTIRQLEELKQQNINTILDLISKVKEDEKNKKKPMIPLLSVFKTSSIKQENPCYAIAFNQDSTIMFAGSGDNTIAIYDFHNSRLQLKQTISDHTSQFAIHTLYFMSSRNQFISGTRCEIGIWHFEKSRQRWESQQLIKQAHNGIVNRVIMNKNEDLIISCSNDKKIKFWIFNNQWVLSKTLEIHSGAVHSISLNQSSTKLASCGSDFLIKISEKDYCEKWNPIQAIKVDQWGYRLSFLDDNFLVFQPHGERFMDTFVLDQSKKVVQKQKNFDVRNSADCFPLFPITYNFRKQILLNKNGSYINIMMRKNEDFFLANTIEFKTNQIFGEITNDGDFCVTWDEVSNSFSVYRIQ